jgi:hypothetical protein
VKFHIFEKRITPTGMHGVMLFLRCGVQHERVHALPWVVSCGCGGRLKFRTMIKWTSYKEKVWKIKKAKLSAHVHCLYFVFSIFIWIEPLLRVHLSYKATFSLSQMWPLNTGLSVQRFVCNYMSIVLDSYIVL